MSGTETDRGVERCESLCVILSYSELYSQVRAGIRAPRGQASGLKMKSRSEFRIMPATRHCLLIVDDEPDVCDSVHDLLRREFRVLKANSAEEGYRIMQEEEVHIVMSDQRMPQITGVELLTKVKARHPQAIRMLFTGFADLESIIAAINQGHIFQFMKKPWQPEELIAAVRQAAAGIRSARSAGARARALGGGSGGAQTPGVGSRNRGPAALGPFR